MYPLENDIFEVSVFGTGFGECVLVHIGNNDWIVIDSCLDPDTGIPCILQYLSSINIDPAKAIKHVVATHWDTDHIEGLAEIVRASPMSRFWISKALKNTDYIRLIYGIPSNIKGVPKTSNKEFLEISEICMERTIRGTMGPIELASENELLMRDVININGNDIEREVIALSPSVAAQVRSLEEIFKITKKPLAPIRNLRQLDNNHTSIVIWVRIGIINILLGADLIELGVSDDGWQRIVNNGKIPTNSKSEVFKIPHHGSENGHNDYVWRNLVEKDNISVLTPFQHGKQNLPKDADKKRILNYSQNAYISGGSIQLSLRKDRDKRDLLRKVNKILDRKKRQLGQVILRKNIVTHSNWSVHRNGVTTKISAPI